MFPSPIIASANITDNGYRKNQEVFAVLDFNKKSEIPKNILIETVDYLTLLMEESSLDQENPGRIRWMDTLEKIKDNCSNWGAEIQSNKTIKVTTAFLSSSDNNIFDQLKKSKSGKHSTKSAGQGDELTSEIRPYEFGDKLEKLDISESIKNAQINHGIDVFRLEESDLQVHETFYQSRTSTVLMIDISHSMILYGEDRITPAKRVAMALSELITTRYQNDTLDIIVFGNDAWQIQIKDLPYLKVGPYHTNTVAGLELAMDILRKRKNPNKQIMMITDGKPTCIKKGKRYIKNSHGLDKNILNRTLALAVKCRKLQIPITTFMIARDPYLVQFVDQFTKTNNGKAFYSSLQGLGEFIFMDYKNNKKKKR